MSCIRAQLALQLPWLQRGVCVTELITHDLDKRQAGADKGLFSQSPFFVRGRVLVNEIIAAQAAVWLSRKGASLPLSYNPHLVMCSQPWTFNPYVASSLSSKILCKNSGLLSASVNFNTFKNMYTKQILRKEKQKLPQNFPHMCGIIGRNSIFSVQDLSLQYEWEGNNLDIFSPSAMSWLWHRIVPIQNYMLSLFLRCNINKSVVY